MYLDGVSTRKVAGITDALSKVRIGKDAVSRIAPVASRRSRGVGGSASPEEDLSLPVPGRHHLPPERPLGR